MRFLRMLRQAEWKGNSESVDTEAGTHGACLEDRKRPVGLEWDILCLAEEGARLESQPMESLKGQADGLGLDPAGSGEPPKVIEQRVTFVLTGWLVCARLGRYWVGEYAETIKGEKFSKFS